MMGRRINSLHQRTDIAFASQHPQSSTCIHLRYDADWPRQNKALELSHQNMAKMASPLWRHPDDVHPESNTICHRRRHGEHRLTRNR